MLRWFRAASDGMTEVAEAFTGMLADGRRVFDLALASRLGESTVAEVTDELNATEERTDEAERRIRRLLLTHASAHGAAEIPACLMYMSVSKDAERVADLSKNLFGIANTVAAPPQGEVRDDVSALRDEISPMVTEAARIFAEEDLDAAGTFIERARDLQRHCHARIEELLREEREAPQPAATALTYRQLARILANLLNIVSAVVVPLDQLDYPVRQPGEE